MTVRQRDEATEQTDCGERWELRLGDCIERLGQMAEASIDLSVFSPPFVALYTYSASERDLGNCSDMEQFLEHFRFVAEALLRVTKPGRLVCCHLAQVASQKAKDGVIGLIDVRGPVINLFREAGWVYHGEVCVQKNPQSQAVRTKAKGLLFVQMRKDASWLRPALADYVLLFRRPGDNAVPIRPDISNKDWIEWAAPVWHGIRESDTLNARQARESDDDRHLAPLQLGVIERCVRLWSNPEEVVLDPFAGIGSTGYVALRWGRRFLGCELKASYFHAACRVLRAAAAEARSQGTLFGARIAGGEVR